MDVRSAVNATPIVVTTAEAHNFTDGAEVKIIGVEGNTAANGSFYVKSSGLGVNVFALYQDQALTRPVAGSGEYTEGGEVRKPFTEDYAIIVGINRYPAFTPLHGPEADAQRFRDWLVSPLGGNVALSNVSMIVSPDPQALTAADAQPTLDTVKRAFRTHWERVLAAKKTNRIGRRFYIFLSGHGITPSKAAMANLDDAALLMADSSIGILDGHVLGGAWADRFRNAAAFDEIVLLMDCCRDLKDNVSPTGAPFLPEIVSDQRDSVKYFYARAAELDSKAWDQQLGNPPDYHGVFSFALMNALQDESVCDSQGRLTSAVLAEYLRSEVRKLRPDQQPVIPAVPKDANIVFIEKRRSFAPNVSVTFTLGPQLAAGSTVELFEATNPDAPCASQVVNGARWDIALSKRSFYKLRVVGGSVEKLFDSKPDVPNGVKNVNFP